MRAKYSEYMHWAKTQSRAKFNLATSGVGAFPLSDLAPPPGALEINGDNSYGYRPLVEAIAAKSGTDPDCVVTAAGTSMANYLAMATLLDPGDEVLIEHPTYELIVSAARYVGADVKRFTRRPDNNYALEGDEIRRVITSKTRLIVMTNLHNPTSVLAPEPALREVGEIARDAGARVLVDEVYLDAVYENTPRTSFHLGPEFVITNSLTKVYGVSGLRCGWILAQPDLARAMWRLNDLFAATPVHPGEMLSVAVMQQLDHLRERARRVVTADRAVLNAFLADHRDFAAPKTEWGTTSFLHLKTGNVEEFLTNLRQRFDTSAVPGRFFEMPDHFRIGMGVNSEMFRQGIQNVSTLFCSTFAGSNSMPNPGR